MRIIHYFIHSRGYQVVALAVLVVVSTFVVISNAGAATTDVAKDGRLITIHDRGADKVILTHAQTIRDALTDAHITMAPQDQVEPSIDSQLVATDYTVNIYRARPVIVVDGAARQKIMTAAQTPESIATAAGVTLHDEDTTTISTSKDIATDGASVVLAVSRAKEFKLNLYGSLTTAYSQEATIGAMLAKKGIKLAASDTLSVPAKTPLKAGMMVEVWRNGVQTATVEEDIPFTTRRIQDADQPVSYRKVETVGTNGKKNVTYEITMQNGKEISRKMIQSVTITEAKEQVETVGAKPTFDGDFAAALTKLRACESGGNYANKKNPLYRGAYQYSYSTWANYGGYYDPADAPPAVQDQAARNTYLRRGWQPWPNCGANLPDIYR